LHTGERSARSFQKWRELSNPSVLDIWQGRGASRREGGRCSWWWSSRLIYTQWRNFDISSQVIFQINILTSINFVKVWSLLPGLQNNEGINSYQLDLFPNNNSYSFRFVIDKRSRRRRNELVPTTECKQSLYTCL